MNFTSCSSSMMNMGVEISVAPAKYDPISKAYCEGYKQSKYDYETTKERNNRGNYIQELRLALDRVGACCRSTAIVVAFTLRKESPLFQ